MIGKWGSLNERALRVLQLGNQAALATHSNEICAEHLLLGFLRAGGAGLRLLDKFSVDLAALKSTTMRSLPAKAIPPEQWRQVPLSAVAERVFDHARREQESSPSKYIGTAHLLLGLLKVEEGGASKLLRGAGVTYDKARKEVVKSLQAGPRKIRVPRTPPPPAEPDRLSEPPAIPRSSEPLIERTKRQIRIMVAKIAELAKQDVNEAEFFEAFLERVVACLAAKGGAIWLLDGDGALNLRYQFQLPETFLTELEECGEPHHRLLEDVLLTGIGSLIAPNSTTDDGQPANPTEFLLIVGAMKIVGLPRGIVEILQRPGAPATTQRGYLKFVEQMCVVARDYLQRQA